ncbi:DUF6397 family protein [Streptomyces anulatus]|uniref:DUF6397 family protein n=1 Tax=Streptomyces anulatus TaxID=1892 RepID=UPI002E2FF3DF|nr:DUF6397 family protein [Streptomyces anulatus]
MTVKEVLRAHARHQAVHAGTQGARGARAECGNVRADARAGDVSTRVEGEGGPTSPAAPAATVAAGRAAQELGIRRAEFELAVHLGLIAVVGAPGGGRPRVHEEEIARLREQPGFPDDLAERVRTVGTAEGAALLDIAPARFTRLARAGCVSPVTFYLNRYRAVVWLYLADELAAFASREPELLAGRTPLGMRTMLESGADWRPRNWRSQRIDRLLNRTKDPWARTAVQASALDPVQLAEVVDDPYERAYLVRVRPEPVFGRPGSMAAREAMGELMLADDPDEILWRRVNLTLELDGAREDRPAPRPGDDGGIRTAPTVRAGAGSRMGTAIPASAAEPAPPSVRPGASGSPAAGVPTGKGLLARLGWRGRCAG